MVMSNEIIVCFNGQECIYAECPVYSAEADLCKMEMFKKTGARGKPIQRPPQQPATQTTMKGAVPQRRFINTLNDGDTKVTVTGAVVFDPTYKDFNRKDGSVGSVTALILNDGTGDLNISFWDEKAEAPLKYKKGDSVTVENLYRVKGVYDGRKQADAGKYFKLS